MKFLHISMLVSVLVAPAFASEKQGILGGDKARELCAEVTGADRKIECLGIISKSRYFEESGIALCSRHAVPFDVNRCLKIIKNKVYSPKELQICESLSFKEKVFQCAKKTGTTYIAQLDPIEKEASETDKIWREKVLIMRHRVEASLNHLDRNRTNKARKSLEKLLKRLTKWESRSLFDEKLEKSSKKDRKTAPLDEKKSG